MPKEKSLPHHPRRSEKYNVALVEGSGELLEEMAGTNFDSVGDIIRAICEDYIKVHRPEAFKRLRGVA